MSTETQIVHIEPSAFDDVVKLLCWIATAPRGIDLNYTDLESRAVRHVLENCDELHDPDGELIDSSDYFQDISFHAGKLVMEDFDRRLYEVIAAPF